ncbi:hypothetical protein [Enterococcus faecium]|uniref:Uncharacterized protein n=1 Tax=Enterococcus faecium (strain ATCC BAA-472 / TX0016 / DO) TaxID=333849 RepID=I3U5X7_ENTFD|nr:hypothetical protein [Enterococcus faecium]AFK60415.1 hypothetical protein HMPREF0351_12791 [Enterococcus faecium DO]
MNLANIGKMFILGRDYSKEHGFPLVSNDEVKKLKMQHLINLWDLLA